MAATRAAPVLPLLRLLPHLINDAAAEISSLPAFCAPAPALQHSRPGSQLHLPAFLSATSSSSVLAHSGALISPSDGSARPTERWVQPGGTRGLSGTAAVRASASAGSSRSGPPLVELRTYTARPDSLKKYLELTGDAAPLRKQLCPGWIGFWTTETGGNLGEVKHLYRYEGWEEREAARAAMQANKEWAAEYLPQIRPLLVSQHSMMFVEAQDCLEAIARAAQEHSPEPAGAHVAAGVGAPVFEWRRYELVPGYHSMPALKKHMLHGLPFRVAAQKSGKCVFMGHSEVGLLNVFLELWRYDSTVQCTQARRAARTSKEWQASIAGIAEVTQNFTSQYLRATSFSPTK